MARGSAARSAIDLGARAAAALSTALAGSAGACASGMAGEPAPTAQATPAPACPRDSRQDRSGRCMCAAGTLQALGACVPPAVGDAFCGKAERLGVDGCSFRACAADEVLDVATGACTPRLALPLAMPARDCGESGAALVEDGRPACVPREVACPRGTMPAPAPAADARRTGAGEALACARPVTCPAGTLAQASYASGACRSTVTTGRGERLRIDAGAWAALVLGPDGGPGSPELCRPLAQRPAAFGVEPGQRLTVRLTLRLYVPDQDVTRAAASVRLMPIAVETVGGKRAGAGAAVPPLLPPAAEAVAEGAVQGLVEPLRSLGGHASSAAVEVEVRCVIANL